MIDKLLSMASIGFRFLSAILHFAIVARALGPEFFGNYSALAAIATMVALLSDFGLPLAISRAMSRAPARPRKFLATAIFIRCLISVPVSLSFAAALEILLPVHGAGFWDIVLMSMAFQLASVIELLATAFRASGDFRRDIVLAAVNTAVYLFFTVFSIAVILELDYAPFLILGVATCVARLGVLSGAVLLNVGLGNLIKGATSISLMATVATRARKMYMDGILNNILENGDVALAAFVLPPLEMASYQSATRISRMTSPLSSALSNVHLPRLFRAVKAGSFDAIRDEIGTLAINFHGLVVLGGISLIVFPTSIIQMLFGADFLPAAATLQILGLVFVNRTLSAFSGIVLVAHDAVRFRVVTQVVTLAVFMSVFLAIQFSGQISSTRIAGAFYFASLVQLVFYTFGAARTSGQHDLVLIPTLTISCLSLILWVIV